MAWHGMAWHGMAWHGMAWHGMAWHGTAYPLFEPQAELPAARSRQRQPLLAVREHQALPPQLARELRALRVQHPAVQGRHAERHDENHGGRVPEGAVT
jgi:hypothetical protein